MATSKAGKKRAAQRKPAQAGALQTAQAQFKNLDTQDPSSWPLVPRAALYAAVAAATAAVVWYFFLTPYGEELDGERATEQTLRGDFSTKLGKAINLERLKQQREQAQQYVTQLERQLPNKAEMDALLSEINQAGLGHSLHFETFRPGAVAVKQYYAELPIALKVTGRYHDFGAFAADVAALSRVVTLSDLSIVRVAQGKDNKDGELLDLNATVRTYRYLDADELAASKKKQ